MGIESEQLVFDYLSRVGDLAHSTRMPAAERARLVSGLRGEIDRRRAEQGGAQNKAAVKKILTRLGKPEEVVATRSPGGAGERPDTGGRESATFVPEPRDPGDGEGPSLRKPESPPPSGSSDNGGEDAPGSPVGGAAAGAFGAFGSGAAPPHLAGIDELGPEESDPEWWRSDPSPYGDGDSSFGGYFGGGQGKSGGGGGSSPEEAVPGFIGGIELPEVLRQPHKDESAEGGAAAPASPAVPAAGADAGSGEPADTPGTGDGGGGFGLPLKSLFRRGKGGAAAGSRAGGVVELAAAALLVTGAVMGSLIPLGLGWLAAWWSPRLSRTEAKWAAAGMPGLVLGGTALWLWGRMDGRWGDPIAQGGEALQQAMSQTFPVLLRVAAVASALFLVWRARRPAGH